MSVRFFEVGGCVRDDLLGIPSKDVDFVCEAPNFEAMEHHLREEGFKLYLITPEFVTIRCSVPKEHPLRERCKDADFVLARRDGPTADGRRPQFVEAGTLADDLARRDFTVNALARDIDGKIIDLHGGIEDLENRLLRFVGDPMQRIREDGLRVMRGWRFSITKGFKIEEETLEALRSDEAAKMLSCVSLERIREELEKMLAHDTLASIDLLHKVSDTMRQAIFREPLRLSASMKKA
jgi:tRNA nucleotidyltransferase/poly(A) polymerase